MERRFLVARNPDPESTLPFLIRLPLGEAGLVIKTRETWPRTSKLYCHRAEGEWPEGVEIVEDVGVRTCERRGVAVDLVLERSRENRSQFVFTRLKNEREAIFWQTARTARKSRPAVRIPGRRASWLGDLTIVVDTRERYPYRFAKQQAESRRCPLPVGDYGVEHDGELVGVVERKTLADLAKGVSDGSLAFQMAELSTLPRSAVVVEERYGAVFKHSHLAPGVFADLLARLQVRYPEVPVVFCDTRPLAEEWTFRFLGAALALYRDHPDDPTAPRVRSERPGA
ncbi:MAG: ERCC4 domain-containing protein [Acidimicrobiia bacterium]